MDVARFSREGILNQLDECAARDQFPMFDNGRIYLADSRLSVYGDETRWALVIEVLGVHTGVGDHYSIEDCLYCFGNCLNTPPGFTRGNVLHPTTDGPERPTFTDKYEHYVRKEAQTIRIRGHTVPINPDPYLLETQGILLVEPPEVTAIDILRSLVLVHRDLLLATEDELRQRVPQDLSLLLRLDEWHHPDVAAAEAPSESETFQLLAEVLVTGDPSKYRSYKEANTHWLHWPGSGRL